MVEEDIGPLSFYYASNTTFSASRLEARDVSRSPELGFGPTHVAEVIRALDSPMANTICDNRRTMHVWDIWNVSRISRD